MGRVIRGQRKGAGSIFTAVTTRRKGAAKLRPLDYAERHGFIKGLVKDIMHDPGRGAPLAKVVFNDPYKYRKRVETLSLLKGLLPANSSTAVRKLPSTSVTSSQSAPCQKVQSLAPWKRKPEIEARSLKLQEATAPSSPTTQTPAELGSSFHLVSKNFTPLKTEPSSASLLVVVDVINLC